MTRKMSITDTWTHFSSLNISKSLLEPRGSIPTDTNQLGILYTCKDFFWSGSGGT